jgi:hypothetical protein
MSSNLGLQNSIPGFTKAVPTSYLVIEMEEA